MRHVMYLDASCRATYISTYMHICVLSLDASCHVFGCIMSSNTRRCEGIHVDESRDTRHLLYLCLGVALLVSWCGMTGVHEWCRQSSGICHGSGISSAQCLVGPRLALLRDSFLRDTSRIGARGGGGERGRAGDVCRKRHGSPAVPAKVLRGWAPNAR